MTRKIQRYGWKRDLPDHRDRRFLAPKRVALPSVVDLSYDKVTKVITRPPTFDQGNLGSCTANAISFHMDFCLMRQKAKTITPSRLFIYYNERVMEGDVSEDGGAQIRDGIKTVAKQGAPPEAVWPYVEDQFATRPPLQTYRIASNHQVESYSRVRQDMADLKACLATGFPFVFGFSVFDSFESADVASTGNLGMPGKDENNVGGHAVCCIGYNDYGKIVLPDGLIWPKNTVLVQNSWGKDWGIRGMFTMPYEYISNPDLADDFWTIRLMEA
jgi:C1A family cysteine protease